MAALLVTLSAMGRLARELIVLFKKPDARALLLWMVGMLLVGMTFYHMIEGWSWLDSLYFSVITLSTVGYGDFDPSTPTSKIFTIVYIFLGLSIFVSFVNMLAKTSQEIHAQRAARVHQANSTSDATANSQAQNPDSTEGQS